MVYGFMFIRSKKVKLLHFRADEHKPINPQLINPQP